MGVHLKSVTKPYPSRSKGSDYSDQEIEQILANIFDNRLRLDKNDIANLRKFGDKTMYETTKLKIDKL